MKETQEENFCIEHLRACITSTSFVFTNTFSVGGSKFWRYMNKVIMLVLFRGREDAVYLMIILTRYIECYYMNNCTSFYLYIDKVSHDCLHSVFTILNTNVYIYINFLKCCLRIFRNWESNIFWNWDINKFWNSDIQHN